MCWIIEIADLVGKRGGVHILVDWLGHMRDVLASARPIPSWPTSSELD